MISFRNLTTCLAATVAAAVVACRPLPPPSPRPAPSARACPAPRLRDVKWSVFNDSSGFALTLPPGAREGESFGASRHWDFGADFWESMAFGIIHGDLGLRAHQRAYQPALMLEYSECSDTVEGYAVSIQAWRTPNGVFRNFRRSDRYDVFAIWEIAPGTYAWFQGGTWLRPSQDIILAAIRAWKPLRR